MKRSVACRVRGWLAVVAMSAATLGVLAVSPAPAVEIIVACCLPDRSCDDLPPSQCEASGGSVIGLDTSCATITCDVAAAPLVSGGALLAVASLLGLFGIRAVRRLRRRL